MKIAIVGSGIAGLTAAHLLYARHELTLFEAGEHVGGHTNTVTLDDDGKPLDIDTGFIVFNPHAYPNFCRLLDKLGVASRESDMSFAVSCERNGIEYAGSGLNTLFGQRRSVLRPSHYRMIFDIMRFNREARAIAAQLKSEPGARATGYAGTVGECAESGERTGSGGLPHSLALGVRMDTSPADQTLREFLAQRRFSQVFIDRYVIPMGAAIWSADPRSFDQVPLRFFVQFLDNHGMLSGFDRPIWRTISGGSKQYVLKLIQPFADRIRLRTPIASIRRDATGVELTPSGAPPERFDHVIIAAHSDQALRMLADASQAEREILTAIPFQRNDTVLHSDASLMPRRRRVWSSWNVRIPQRESGMLNASYYMNLLMGLRSRNEYFVTLNETDRIAPASVRRRIEYHHPVFTLASVAAQQRWAEISGVNRTHFCGAYWRFGFHEDGVWSGIRAARSIEPSAEL
ncbi:MAG: NAD(P)/FAD-dependent oxidoreductase [Phycisphaerae bacterium]